MSLYHCSMVYVTIIFSFNVHNSLRGVAGSLSGRTLAQVFCAVYGLSLSMLLWRLALCLHLTLAAHISNKATEAR